MDVLIHRILSPVYYFIDRERRDVRRKNDKAHGWFNWLNECFIVILYLGAFACISGCASVIAFGYLAYMTS